MKGRRWTGYSFTGDPAGLRWRGGAFAGDAVSMSPLAGLACSPALVIPYVLLAISVVINFYQGILLSRGVERTALWDESNNGRRLCPCPHDIEHGLAGVEDPPPVEDERADVRAVGLESVQQHPRALGTSSGEPVSGSSIAASSNTGDHAPHHHDALFFLFNIILFGTAILHVSSLVPAMQFTVMLFVLGMVVSLFLEGLNLKDQSGILGDSYKMWMDIDPHLLLFTMLPTLLAGDAMSIDTSVAKRVANQCLYLAGPGVLVSALSVAGFLSWYMQWDFLLSLVTSSILCATDPVAVVALLKELGASPMLTVQIQGESLLNDGTAIVLYTLAYDMLRGETYDFTDMMMFMVKSALMACAVGAFLGYAFFSWLRVANDRFNHSSSVIQILLTLSAAYWSFIMAEGVLNMSGVLATVSSSLVLAHHMWPHMVSQDTMCHFWHCLEDLMNIIIFLLGGALCGAAMVHIEFIDYVHLIVIYMVLLGVRGCLIFGSRPVLRWLSHDRLPVTLSDAAVMTWGGLRGAVGLALAIQVRRGRAPDANGIPQIDAVTGDRVLFFVSGIAFLTTIVNATSAPYLVQELGLTALPEVQEIILRKFNQQLVDLSVKNENPPEVTECLKTMLKHIDEELHERSVKCQHHVRENFSAHMKNAFKQTFSQRRSFRELRSPDPERVCKAHMAARAIWCSIPDEEKTRLDHLPCALDELALYSEEMINVISSNKADEELCKVVNKTFMSLVYTNYHKQIQAGDLRPGSLETDVLFTSIRVCLSPLTVLLTDLDFIMHSISHQGDAIGHVQEEATLPMDLRDQYRRLGKSVSFGPGVSKTKSERRMRESFGTQTSLEKIALSDDGLEGSIVATGSNSWDALNRFVASQRFALACVFAILLNAVYVAVDEVWRDSSNDKNPAWLVFEWAFCSVFLAEAVIKIIQAPIKYFKDGWNQFDFFLVLIGIFGAIISTISFNSSEQINADGASESRIIRLSRVLRTMRFLRIFRLFHAKLSADKFVSHQLAVCMHKMQTLTFFVHAHIIAQKQLMKYFLGTKQFTREVEIARCILQSQSSVHKALISIISIQRTMDCSLLDELIYTKERKRIVEDLEAFVQDAATEGAINSREAQAILAVMHAEISDCLHVINKRTDGFISKKLDETEAGPHLKKAMTAFYTLAAHQKFKESIKEPQKESQNESQSTAKASKTCQPASTPKSPRSSKEGSPRPSVIPEQVVPPWSQVPPLHQADSAGGLSVVPPPPMMCKPGEEQSPMSPASLISEGAAQQAASSGCVDPSSPEPQEVGSGDPDSSGKSNMNKKIKRKKSLHRASSKPARRGTQEEVSPAGIETSIDDSNRPAGSSLEGILEDPLPQKGGVASDREATERSQSKQDPLQF